MGYKIDEADGQNYCKEEHGIMFMEELHLEHQWFKSERCQMNDNPMRSDEGEVGI